jgi:small subunit ribosomal protein S2
MPTQVGIRELLEAGVHFGHQTRRWNPKMRRFIHGERTGIYIIDLLKTEQALLKAQEFAAGIARRGGTILFVGTKKQARDAVQETAERCGMPYIQHRWLGGVLTNYQTISQRIKRLHDLERYQKEGQLELLPTQERMKALADLEKLQNNLGGVKFMTKPPDAIFIVDLKTEEIAVREAQRLRIPIIGLVDTNCDPDGIQYVIPGNDDAIKSCALILRAMGDVILENRTVWKQAEEDRQKREQEAAAARAAEEAARVAAEQEKAREAAERLEQLQGEAAATNRANSPHEGGSPAGGAKPHPAPTVAEDLQPRPGAVGGRGKKQKAPQVAPEGATGPGAPAGPEKLPEVAPASAEAVAAEAPAAEAPAPAAEAPTPAADAAVEANAEAGEKAAEKPKRSRAKKADPVQVAGEAPSGEAATADAAPAEEKPAEEKPKKKPAARKPKAKKAEESPAAEEAAAAPAETATEETTE